SPAMEQALAPLKRLAAQAAEAHAAALTDYKLAVKLAGLKSEAAEKEARKSVGKASDAELLHLLDGDEPEPPTLKRYIAGNTTAEAFGELHRQNPNGLLAYRDELVSLLKSLDREDNAEARGFYLTGWNGDSPYTFDRIVRGFNLHIPAVCLSLLGSTQPGRIAEYIRAAVRGGAADDGLIQRFGLLVWPDNGGDWRDVDRWPDSEAKKKAFQVFDDLDKLDPVSTGAVQDKDSSGEPDGLPYLRFDTGGLGLFQEWRADLEKRLRGSELHPAMESHLAKYRKLVPGLALILHLANNGTGPVMERATLQALGWGEYLETHALRAYASVAMPEVAAAKAIIHRLRKGDLARTFSSRDVWRPGWALLSDREQVADALRLLVELDWLAVSKRETEGRTATVYEANPTGLQ
ncbi:MAG TPA: YfjI family protein, partial [Methylococcaceae bacterium]|nr:YfjI family protein [Methylococcaceae bacterium]